MSLDAGSYWLGVWQALACAVGWTLGRAAGLRSKPLPDYDLACPHGFLKVGAKHCPRCNPEAKR